MCWIACVFMLLFEIPMAHQMCVRWLLYFALRSIESMNKNQTAVHVVLYSTVHKCEGANNNVLSIEWRMAKWCMVAKGGWHTRTLCLFCTYNWQNEAYMHEYMCMERKGVRHSKGAWFSFSVAQIGDLSIFLNPSGESTNTYRRSISTFRINDANAWFH